MQFRTRAEIAAHLGAVRRLKTWTRTRFSLGEDATVLVEQNACTLPGFPPTETVTTFWTSPDCRHEFKVFKPVAEVLEDDLPPSWMKAGLAVETALGCTCC